MILFYRSILLFTTMISLFFCCSPQSCGFSSNNLYSREKFSGADLYDKTIGICPLLRDTLKDTVQILFSEDHFEELRKTRTDLHFISAGEMEKLFLQKWQMDSLQCFYKLLFKGEIAALQTRDSIWSGLTSDYYMVIRMANASTVKTFNNTVRKRLHVEAELWDCKDHEVLWRTSVKGVCADNKTPDSRFIMDAVKNAYSGLPAILPSYGNQAW